MYKPLRFLRKAAYYIPFTLYLAVFAAILIPGYLKLRTLSTLPDSAYTSVFGLLLTVTLFVGVSILVFGLLTVLSAFLYFKWQQQKGRIHLDLHTENHPQNGKQGIGLEIRPILLPLAGFIRVRLFYDGTHISGKFTPASEGSSFFGLRFKGRFTWDLPEIREYRIERVMIYFEDFFQFFSLVATMDANNRFHISPQEQALNPLKASPRKTEETTTRIEELKRVEGELINYKSFETNDDVRRIVWKIYAKNKELVVRIPEILDPYASHIYLYPSFYSRFGTEGNELLEAPFLNYYKSICWSVYRQLSNKGLDVRYVPDQPIPASNLPAGMEQTRYAITVSSWQREQDLKDFIKPSNASVLIVSSLSDPEQLREFAESHGNEIFVILVPLSDCLDTPGIAGWLRWLFVENEKDLQSSYRSRWSLSPMRLKLRENEKELAAVLKLTSKATII